MTMAAHRVTISLAVDGAAGAAQHHAATAQRRTGRERLGVQQGAIDGRRAAGDGRGGRHRRTGREEGRRFRFVFVGSSVEGKKQNVNLSKYCNPSETYFLVR
jgi:hypothetical protein